MEAIFDNKANILNARIRTTHDNVPIYSIMTSSGLRGRKITIIKDLNPLPDDLVIVGAINWREKTFEVRGHRKAIKDIRRKEGTFWKSTKFWKWGSHRKEYEFKFHKDEWTVTLSKNDSLAARFLVPFRPHLFSKGEPARLHLTPKALEDDEVFLLLAFIYSEAKRQDRTSTSCDVGW
ncbi:hypothetical protein AX16_000889 [Volvariella volvacea WC 439]|nr:hypothetical protein AX16_000889 [Volvariella volvacea WC 439]